MFNSICVDQARRITFDKEYSILSVVCDQKITLYGTAAQSAFLKVEQKAVRLLLLTGLRRGLLSFRAAG